MNESHSNDVIRMITTNGLRPESMEGSLVMFGRYEGRMYRRTFFDVSVNVARKWVCLDNLGKRIQKKWLES